jgi:hypothetical protein
MARVAVPLLRRSIESNKNSKGAYESMKKVLAGLFMAAVATAAFAQSPVELNHGNIHAFPAKGYAGSGGGAGNLVYHSGGSVIRNANVVCIFWGPSWQVANSTDAKMAAEIQGFRNQFGTAPEYATITQYYGEDAVSGYGNIATGSLANQADWFDGSTPPTNVTDSIVQSEVKAYIASHGADYNAIYEVFIPSSSYSSDGTSTSCGGPNLAYCAYHSHYTDGTGKNVKYSIEPYPSCSGCHASGFTTNQDAEHFMCHETREAVTDALGNAWFDRRGYEADDKCAWSPAPFVGTGGYGYQYEWSNAKSACVKQ